VGDLALLVFSALAFVSGKTKCAKCAVGFQLVGNVQYKNWPLIGTKLSYRSTV